MQITFYDFAVNKIRFYQDTIAADLARWIFENSKHTAPELRSLNRRQWTRFLKLMGHDQLSFKALRIAWAMFERAQK